MLQKIKQIIIGHKIISIIVFILIIVGCYFLFKTKTSAETRYTTETVQKGNVAATVTGTGQVEASDTLNLSPKNSGDITYVGVKVGDSIKKGKLIATIDSRDAKLALENAKITLAKLVGAPDTLTLLQKQNSIDKSYSDGLNLVASSILDSTSIVDGLGDLFGTGYLNSSNIMNSGNSIKAKVNTAESSYYQAKNSLNATVAVYKGLSQTSDKKDIESLISKMHDTAKIIANSVKITQTAFDAVVMDLDSKGESKVISTQSNLTSWTNTANNYVSSLSSSTNSIIENNQSLSDFTAGADELDIRSAQLTVDNKQAAYNDCFIYAPFDGVIAAFTATVGEPSGSSIGTLITKNKLATITLNEVDIAKIKVGQKATLTFDAIDGLTITGKVAEIDSIGTVSQGVVTYTIKISLDTGDNLIKPGMSVSATIITDMAQDVLIVPNSALKVKNGVNYVEIFSSPLPSDTTGAQGSLSINPPTQINVEIGLVDDSNTEITSGLKEGDIIVTKTITNTVTTAKSTTPSLLNAVGGGGGSAMRSSFRGN